MNKETNTTVEVPFAILIEPLNVPKEQLAATLGKYGDIHTLFEREKPFSIWDTVAFQRAIATKLDELGYKPELDYLVLQGSLLPVTLLVSAAKTLAPNVNLLGLCYSSVNEGGYRTVVIPNT